MTRTRTRARRRGRAGGSEDAKLYRLLEAYEDTISDWADSALRTRFPDPSIQIRLLPRLYVRLANAHALEMFLTLLRTYQFDSKMRTAIERAAQAFSRQKAPAVTAKLKAASNAEKALAIRETVEGYRKLGELARTAIERGRPCGEGDVCGAGCFKLVNAGGFDQKDVEHVRALTEKAAEILRARGFEQICYGDVQIVRQVHRDSTLAHYMVREDQIYIRGNLPKNDAPTLETILHELGHRLESRFLDKAQTARKETLFRAYKRALDSSGFGAMATPPAVGSRITIKKREYVVIEIGYNRALDKVIRLSLPEEPGAVFSIPLDAWLQGQGHKRADDRFVSTYAKTNEDENFCEMFAGYLLGLIGPSSAADFVRILKG